MALAIVVITAVNSVLRWNISAMIEGQLSPSPPPRATHYFRYQPSPNPKPSDHMEGSDFWDCLPVYLSGEPRRQAGVLGWYNVLFAVDGVGRPTPASPLEFPTFGVGRWATPRESE